MGMKKNLGPEARLAKEQEKEKSRKASRWSRKNIMRGLVLVVLAGLVVAVVLAGLGHALA